MPYCPMLVELGVSQALLCSKEVGYALIRMAGWGGSYDMIVATSRGERGMLSSLDLVTHVWEVGIDRVRWTLWKRIPHE